MLYPSSYSSDLNPIESAFWKREALLRKAGERTVDGLWRLPGRLVDPLPPGECRKFLTHSKCRAASS